MMKRDDYLQKIYEKNPETGHYIIEVSLGKYTDIFNDWDSSSFIKRDIDPDLEKFLASCSSDIPIRHGIDIYFYIPKEIENKEIEKLIILKFKNYYSFYYRSEVKFLKESFRRTFGYILAAFIFLFLSLSLESKLNKDNIFYTTLLEGLDIGGWVFLWEAISFFFFKRGKIVNRIREYKRLFNSSIYFKCQSSG